MHAGHSESGIIAASTAAFAIDLGIPILDLQRASGLDLARLMDTFARKPDDTTARLWQLISKERPDLCPLEKARTAALTTLPVAEALPFASTLSEILEFLVDAAPAISDRLDMSLHYAESEVRLVFSHPSEELDDGRTSEVGAGIFYRSIRASLEQLVPLKRVQLRNRPHGRLEGYQATFDTEMQFNAPETALCFDLESLLQTTRLGNAEVFAHVKKAFLDRKSTQFGARDDRFSRLCAAVSENAQKGEFRAVAGARKAHMSLRTAQRVAAEHDVALSSLVANVRMEQGARLLRQPQLSTMDVAVALGYSDDRAFRRAFKKWCGRTPMAYRKENR